MEKQNKDRTMKPTFVLRREGYKKKTPLLEGCNSSFVGAGAKLQYMSSVPPGLGAHYISEHNPSTT